MMKPMHLTTIIATAFACLINSASFSASLLNDDDQGAFLGQSRQGHENERRRVSTFGLDLESQGTESPVRTTSATGTPTSGAPLPTGSILPPPLMWDPNRDYSARITSARITALQVLKDDVNALRSEINNASLEDNNASLKDIYQTHNRLLEQFSALRNKTSPSKENELSPEISLDDRLDMLAALITAIDHKIISLTPRTPPSPTNADDGGAAYSTET